MIRNFDEIKHEILNKKFGVFFSEIKYALGYTRDSNTNSQEYVQLRKECEYAKDQLSKLLNIELDSDLIDITDKLKKKNLNFSKSLKNIEKNINNLLIS